MQPRRRQRRSVEDGIEYDAGSLSAEGQRSRRHFIEHRAEREQIGAGVEFFAANLLGRHVDHGSKSGPRTCEMFGIDSERGQSCGRGFSLRARVRDFGETEIEDFCVAALCDKNICGFNIAVNNTLGVGGIEGIGNLDSEVEHLIGFHWPARDHMLECLSFETFHGDEGLAILFTDIMNCANVRVI